MIHQRTGYPGVIPGSVSLPWPGSLGGPLDRPLLSPAFRRLSPPVIVIGMHRSGTSIVSTLLGMLGVYMGPELAEDLERVADPGCTDLFERGYGESQEFRLLNERVLAQAGATWCSAEPFLAHRYDPAFAFWSWARMLAATFGRLRSRYLECSERNSGERWGWKDPRTSLLLPYWLRLFPDALLVHVRRNPEAAAQSLARRARLWSERQAALPALGGRLQAALRDPAGTARRLARKAGLLPAASAPGDPCLSLDYCRTLGECYVRECLQHRDHAAGYLEVAYEELLENPVPVVRDLAGFAGLSAPEARIRLAASLVRREGGRPAR